MNNWLSFALVAIGGAFGAVSRYKLSELIMQQMINWRFPIATFIINIMGCLLIGLLAGMGERFNWLTVHFRLLLITGLLGGFTTFSAFGLETLAMLRRGDVLMAMSYATLSVLIGIFLVWLGFVLSTSFGSNV